jgi:hypothetical protein
MHDEAECKRDKDKKDEAEQDARVKVGQELS